MDKLEHLSHPEFKLSENNAYTWDKYIRRFEILLRIQRNLTEEQQLDLLLYVGGDDVLDLYDTLLQVGTTDKYTKYQEFVKAVKDKFTPTTNMVVNRMAFRQAMQEPEENIENFIKRLREQAKFCNFENVDNEIVSQVTIGCSEGYIKKIGMENPALTLEEFIAKVMQAERIRQSLIQMQTSSINRIHVLPEANKSLRKISRNNILSKFFNCGEEWPHREVCPVKGKTCNFCGKIDHLEACCREKFQNRVGNS